MSANDLVGKFSIDLQFLLKKRKYESVVDTEVDTSVRIDINMNPVEAVKIIYFVIVVSPSLFLLHFLRFLSSLFFSFSSSPEIRLGGLWEQRTRLIAENIILFLLNKV